MIRRYVQRRQAKCNFCFQWFSTTCSLKNSIHLCDICLDKALNTSCYKVQSSDGKNMYQLYLFKNNLKIQEMTDPQEQENVQKIATLQNIDQYRNQQLRKVSQKWAQVTQQIKKISQFDQLQSKEFTLAFDQQINKCRTSTNLLDEKNRKKVNKVITQNFKQTPNKIQITENKQNYDQREFKTAQVVQQSPIDAYFATQNNIPLLPLSNLSQNKYFSPKKQLVFNSVGNNNKPPKYRAPVQFNRGSLSTKLNQRNNIAVNNRRQAVCTSSFNTDRSDDQKKSSKSSTQRSNLGVNNLKKKISQPIYDRQKREKDLQLIALNALKSKIYNYLETYSTVSPALYLPMTFQIYDALQNTTCLNKCIELTSYNIQQIDIKCYLNMLEWNGVDVLKLVKVGLTDFQFKEVLNFIKDKKLQTLVVSSNRLTQSSIIQLKEAHQSLQMMKNVYIGRNRVQKTKVRQQIKQIENRFLLYI